MKNLYSVYLQRGTDFLWGDLKVKMPPIKLLLASHLSPNETSMCRNKDTKHETKTYEKSIK